MPFVVGLVTSCEELDKRLKKCVIDVGVEEELVVVTNASNVRNGTRTVVALIGTELGDETKVEARSVGGVKSHGMLCDSKMLNWQGGAEGICVQVPDSFKPGDTAPSSKPRMDGRTTAAAEPEKSDKELKAEAKAAKKAEAAAKKDARKAKKASKSDDAAVSAEEGASSVLDGVEKLSVEEA